MKKSFSLSDIRNYKPKAVEFDGMWRDSIGDPELKGSWIIWGPSGNGKTSFAMQLAMYFTKFTKVIYDSIEEGMSMSIQTAIRRISVDTESKYRFNLLDKVSIKDLRAILSKQRSARVVVIDSIQYTGLNHMAYKALRDDFPNKLFIFVSHAEGNEPKGDLAKSVKYDAFVKILVSNFVAYPMSRYGGGEPFIIYEAEANKQPIKTKNNG